MPVRGEGFDVPRSIESVRAISRSLWSALIELSASRVQLSATLSELSASCVRRTASLFESCPRRCSNGPRRCPNCPRRCPTCPRRCPFCPRRCPNCPRRCPNFPRRCPNCPRDSPDRASAVRAERAPPGGNPRFRRPLGNRCLLRRPCGELAKSIWGSLNPISANSTRSLASESSASRGRSARASGAVRMSRVLFSRSGQTAVAFVDWRCGPTCGHTIGVALSATSDSTWSIAEMILRSSRGK